jgi:hypothetical protein
VQSSSSSSSPSECRFRDLWKSDTPVFSAVKQQYERMLKLLPPAQAEQWKEQVGLLSDETLQPDDSHHEEQDSEGDGEGEGEGEGDAKIEGDGEVEGDGDSEDDSDYD